MTAYAFRCEDCGHLEEGPFAGDRPYPSNCRHCDVGSHLSTREVLVYVKDELTAEMDRLNLAFTKGFLLEDAYDTQADAIRARMEAGDWESRTETFQVIDRPNRFTILADLTDKEQTAILKAQADPGDTIVRYDPKAGTK